MILRSLICSNRISLGLIPGGSIPAGVLLAGLILSGSLHARLDAAEVSGSVMLRDSRVEAVNRKKDFAGVVVYAERVDAPPPVAPIRHAVMLQKNKMFTPH